MNARGRRSEGKNVSRQWRQNSGWSSRPRVGPLPSYERAESGTTLLEMLLACALLAMLLLAATGAHVKALEASDLSEEVGFRGQVTELATELLEYHLGLAGHRGLTASLDLGGPALSLSRPARGGSDALAVRYVEERWYSQPELRVLRFDVRRDSGGRWNLYLQEEGANRQPAVQNVSALRVERVITVEGESLPGDTRLPLDVVALVLRLEFTWGEERTVTIGLPRVVRLVEEAS